MSCPVESLLLIGLLNHLVIHAATKRPSKRYSVPQDRPKRYRITLLLEHFMQLICRRFVVDLQLLYLSCAL